MLIAIPSPLNSHFFSGIAILYRLLTVSVLNYHWPQFLLQMVGLHRDPQGDTIFSKASGENPTLGVGSNSTKPSDEVHSLRRRIKELEDEAKAKEVNIIL